MSLISARTVVIVGASGGIGAALLRLMVKRESQLNISCIIATYCLTAPDDSLKSELGKWVHWQYLDIRNTNQIEAFCQNIATVDWLINCVGVLHTDQHSPEKTVRGINMNFLQESFLINTQPTLVLAKLLSKKLDKRKDTVFLAVSAKVGSIEDNNLGGWYSYRVTKAALNMALKCLANEWRYSLPQMRVAAYHPGTTDTQLSKPFQANVPQTQLLSPEKSASLLLERLCKLHQFPTGQFWSWNGSTLPW